MQIVLYGRPFNRTDRVQWTLEELGVPYEYVKLDVFGKEHRDPRFRTKYPLARLPFVEVDGKVLFESAAIMMFLALQFREQNDLILDQDKTHYPYVLQWLFFACSTLEASDGSLASNSDPAPFAPLVDTLSFLNAELEGKQFIVSNQFTLADIALANGFKWFDPELISSFPNVLSYFKDHTSRPAYKVIERQEEYRRRTS